MTCEGRRGPGAAAAGHNEPGGAASITRREIKNAMIHGTRIRPVNGSGGRRGRRRRPGRGGLSKWLFVNNGGASGRRWPFWPGRDAFPGNIRTIVSLGLFCQFRLVDVILSFRHFGMIID
ncbi:hypothetical protein Zmor_017223 [Zophobas morio]|uniref:Uncharacterized protein n=1 Tax=Zophobas morio TaxID=2755281 RepID=A0AA38I8F4_9CUCU|nr:hypothetical protein Zmor_017223 [Zophobas morio]